MKLRAIKAVFTKFRKVDEHTPSEEDFNNDVSKEEKLMNDLIDATNNSIRVLNAWVDQKNSNKSRFIPQWRR